MSRVFRGVVAVCLLAFGLVHAQDIIRTPVAAGPFYPDDPETLSSTVAKLFDEAVAPMPTARLVACIAPHSAYGFSGAVTAHAFKGIKPGQYDRVLILAPSHFATIEGCSVPDVAGFATPLGVVPVDRKIVDRLCRCPLIACKALHQREAKKGPHEQEYAIETLLPFLQVKLKRFTLIPILVGKLNDAQGKFNMNTCAAVAEAISNVVDTRTLIVASSDLTHYGAEYGFRPFKDNVLESIEALDQQAIQALQERDGAAFKSIIDQVKDPVCGDTAIQVLLRLLPAHARGVLAAYDMSGKKTQSTDNSVSYAAINFYDPTLPVNIQRAGQSFATSKPQPRGTVVLKRRGNAAEEAAMTAPEEAAPEEATPEEAAPEEAAPLESATEPAPESPQTGAEPSSTPHVPKPQEQEAEEAAAAPAKVSPELTDIPPSSTGKMTDEKVLSTAKDRPEETVMAETKEMPKAKRVAETVAAPAEEEKAKPSAPRSTSKAAPAKRAPVLIRMKGTGQPGSASVEVQGTPVGTGEQGHVSYQGSKSGNAPEEQTVHE